MANVLGRLIPKTEIIISPHLKRVKIFLSNCLRAKFLPSSYQVFFVNLASSVFIYRPTRTWGKLGNAQDFFQFLCESPPTGEFKGERVRRFFLYWPYLFSACHLFLSNA